MQQISDTTQGSAQFCQTNQRSFLRLMQMHWFVTGSNCQSPVKLTASVSCLQSHSLL